VLRAGHLFVFGVQILRPLLSLSSGKKSGTSVHSEEFVRGQKYVPRSTYQKSGTYHGTVEFVPQIQIPGKCPEHLLTCVAGNEKINLYTTCTVPGTYFSRQIDSKCRPFPTPLKLDQAFFKEYCMQSLRQKNTVCNTVCVFDNQAAIK
jgi:hypothetical protein